ncbi:YdcF family protein [Actinopolymorpha alba]|uniref:YdcF family protein n=1 Tax=Actinopolymorpha alba TaxID=533267 RepID=UPI000366D0AC|nr:YdcF family protein [Actinopolymorpha alba]
MTTATPVLTDDLYADLQTLWDYHQVREDPRPSSVAIGLGSHDLGVATCAADLYHRGIFPLIVFTGANSPTTIDRFPRGEAIQYREHAITLGVPAEAIIVEPQAVDTAQNIEYSRKLLEAHGLSVDLVTLISRPYQLRRSWAMFRKLWPTVNVQCASQELPLADYLNAIGDTKRVVDRIVGDTQRIFELPKRGLAISQDMPDEVLDAYNRLCAAGFTSRLMNH